MIASYLSAIRSCPYLSWKYDHSIAAAGNGAEMLSREWQHAYAVKEAKTTRPQLWTAMREPSTEPWTLTARWIFPVELPPLERGTVTIAGERIVSVDAHGKRTADVDLGNAAVLPGLVNAHTHLDLTGLRGKVPPAQDFTQWLRRVIGHRLSRTLEQVEEDIQQGLEESAAYGTTLLGDISARGASWLVLATSPYRGRAVVFYELLGLPKARAHQAWA